MGSMCDLKTNNFLAPSHARTMIGMSDQLEERIKRTAGPRATHEPPVLISFVFIIS